MKQVGSAMVLAAIILATAGAAGAALKDVTIVTGPSGGSFYPVGAMLGEIFNKNGIRAGVQPGGGVSNIISVQMKKADVGMTMAFSLGDAYKGVDPFKTKMEDVVAFAALYPNYIQFVLAEDAKIGRIEELRGRKISSPLMGQAGQVLLKEVLWAYGLKETDVNLVRGSQSEGVDAMKDRHLEGWVHTTAVPAPSIVDIMTARKVRFLSVDESALAKLIDKNPGFAKGVIPANTYKGQEKEIVTVKTATILVVSRHLPEADAHTLARLVVDNVETLRNSHASMKDMSLQEIASVGNLPLHPGAKKFYQERGLLK